MALLVWSGSALPQPYKAAELGLLPGGTYTYAAAINNAAQVAGAADEGFDNPAVIWNGTIPTTVVNAVPGFGSVGSAINNLGVMVGGGSPPNGAFVWSPTLYNRLGPAYGIYSPNSINDSGTIVGDGPPSLALFWASPYATTWTLLPQLFPENFSLSSASGINNAGQIVGASVLIDDFPFINGAQHATLWNGEKVTDLGTLGGTNSDAAAIGDSGQIVGWADTQSGAQHAAMWIGTKVTDLGTLSGTNSHANAVNSSGEIVGAADTASGAQHAALFIGGKVTDLNSALSSSLARYVTLTEATGINDSHLIVANGTDSRTGLNLGFLLTPNIEVLNCIQGNLNFYQVVKPSNSVSSAVSPDSSGIPSRCAIPSTEPATWYVKTTTDGGDTWQWTRTLEDLGLGSIPPDTGVLNCIQGNLSLYRVVKPSNSVSSAVSPNSLGRPNRCALPSSEPATWYIKTTTDSGATWHWVMLSSLGLGY